MQVKEAKQLNDQERIFVLEYLADEKMNAERAALKAGYSKSVARTKAFMWVSKSKQNPKPHVALYIAEILKKRESELQQIEQKVVKARENIAFSNLPKMIEKMEHQITLKGLSNLSEDEQVAIQTVAVDGEKVTIKLFDKEKSLAVLEKRIEAGKESVMKDVPRIMVVKDEKLLTGPEDIE